MKAEAARRGLPVTHRVADVVEAGVDLGVVVAFGRLIKPDVLAAVPMVNVHFSLLPRWRGAAPVERAILAGDPETGVCLMEVEEGLDTGPVYSRSVIAIDPDETADELRDRLVAVAVPLLVNALRNGLGRPEPQAGEPTYAAKLEPDEFLIDWSRSADEVHRLVRLGRAWTPFRGKRLRVLGARPVAAGPGAGLIDGLIVGTGDGGGLELVEVQPEGKSPQAAVAWRNGARPISGERVGE